jgi:hypothetical protein
MHAWLLPRFRACLLACLELPGHCIHDASLPPEVKLQLDLQPKTPVKCSNGQHNVQVRAQHSTAKCSTHLGCQLAHHRHLHVSTASVAERSQRSQRSTHLGRQLIYGRHHVKLDLCVL